MIFMCAKCYVIHILLHRIKSNQIMIFRNCGGGGGGGGGGDNDKSELRRGEGPEFSELVVAGVINRLKINRVQN